MKRHEALAPLSREHHSALILAQTMKKGAPAYKGLPTDTDGKINYAVDFYKTQLIEHFNKEEEVFEKVKHVHKDIDNLIVEITEEHKELKKIFTELETTSDKIDVLDEAGNMLELHVRKEERVLFPLIQKYCGDELLSQL